MAAIGFGLPKDAFTSLMKLVRTSIASWRLVTYNKAKEKYNWK